MARVESCKEVLEQAKDLLANASTIEELRQAQAVVLPLQFGLSMEQTATAIGTSIGWACQLFEGVLSAMAAYVIQPSPPVVDDGAKIFLVKKKLPFSRPL